MYRNTCLTSLFNDQRSSNGRPVRSVSRSVGRLVRSVGCLVGYSVARLARSVDRCDSRSVCRSVVQSVRPSNERPASRTCPAVLYLFNGLSPSHHDRMALAETDGPTARSPQTARPSTRPDGRLPRRGGPTVQSPQRCGRSPIRDRKGAIR